MRFEELFTELTPEEMMDSFNEFKLVGKDFYAITAGKAEHYNSMVGSGGGFGLIFRKPGTWCFIREDRYTLELINQAQSYTLSYFPEEHKKQLLALASGCGKSCNKMQESELTGIVTPSGNISFEEAKLIVECKLTAQLTGEPESFCTQEARDYINAAYAEEHVYRKIVFGEISHVWIKKRCNKGCA
ncbi:MAG: hypothetical protein LBS74_05255 [Oscillospiraceae bacterium]|jgi:flavin reductase (DIM6/NTAB) family NADH-FMN oxidoreductase RutF|nr:hypothetical protein [Oscillospiraceae bacterium]